MTKDLTPNQVAALETAGAILGEFVVEMVKLGRRDEELAAMVAVPHLPAPQYLADLLSQPTFAPMAAAFQAHLREHLPSS